MPILSANGDVYQVRLKWTLHQQQCFNVLHFLSNGSQDIETELLDEVIDCIITSLLPGLSNELTFNGADAKRIKGATEIYVDKPVLTGNVGGIAQQSLPSTNAAVLTLQTLVANRRSRGRLFIPGIAETNAQDSRLTAALITVLTNFAVCMIGKFKAGDPPAANQFIWTVFSRAIGGSTFPANAGATKQVEAVRVNTVIGSQRSRKVGRGV